MLNATSNKLWISLGAIVFAATACTTEVVGNDPDDPSQGGSGGATTTTSSEGGSGGGGGQALDVTRNVDISECGGFQPLSGSGDSGDEPQAPPPAYCEAEVLYWVYDAERQELSFNDSRVELNCCGDHAISVSKQGDTVTVTETDEPEGGDGRCNCLCVFDFGATAGPIEQGIIQVELVRNVTDSGDPMVVWQGAVDLSDGAGFEMVDTTPSSFCEPYDSGPSAS